MTPLESIFYMIWRGVAIGVMISAPMGPVGILCIQRTLYKGRKAGLFTGIGAAISDLIYCLLTGFGLSFIEDFINANQGIIQFLGSLVLIGFSIYLFKKNPSSSIKRPLPQNVSARKNILGGFLFTFSNPLIVFLIIGLFARFNFTNPEIHGIYYAVGYLFIIAGALGWWYGVTFAIDKVRCRFNMQSMKTLNIIIGIIILCFAAVGIVTSIIDLTSVPAKAGSGFPDRKTLIADTVVSNQGEGRHGITLIDRNISPSPYFQVDFKAANQASSPMKRYAWNDNSGEKRSAHLPPWSISITDSGSDTVRFEIRISEVFTSPIDSQSALVVSIIDTDGSVIDTRTLTKDINSGAGWNHFRILSSAEDGITLLGGNRSLKRLASYRPDGREFLPVEMLVESDPGNSLELKQVCYSAVPHPSNQISHLEHIDIIERLRTSADPAEGKWGILDSSMNEELLLPGGDYTLATIRCPDGSYELVYLDGASVNGNAWTLGMLKGKLIPTGISTIYNLEWIDPMGAILNYRLKAQFESADLLTLQFPYHDSSLRLHRLNY